MLKKDFICSVARMRALESTLLNDSQVERMLGAETAEDAFKILNDLDWAEFLPEANRPEEFNEVLYHGLLEVKHIIEGEVEHDGDFDFLWLLFDLHNAKVLTKALLKEQDADSIKSKLSLLGSISRGSMRRIIFEDEKIVGFEWLLPIIEDIKKDFEQNKKPENVEFMLEQAFFAKILNLVKESKSEMMHNFFIRMIDIKNIMSFLKRKNTDFIIDGGSITKSSFDKNFVNNIHDFHLKEIVESEVEDNEVSSYLSLENKLDEYLFEVLLPSKIDSDNVNPIFAYFWQKKRNAEIIRAIMVAKLNGIDNKKLRSWLKTPSLTM
jgi:V/A-type H+-transporting ATPase subunit C